jgi:hypothetical protein
MVAHDRDDPASMIALAERVERDSRTGLGLRVSLDELHGTLVHCEAPWTKHDDVAMSEAVARMRRIVDQIRRDVDGGHVRSISGLSAEARRLARTLEHSGLTPV